MIKKRADYYATRQDGVVESIPADARRILEVGCGMGLTGRAVKEKLKNSREVTGIEINPGIAQKARSNIDRVITGDAETIELPFEEGYFDCIIYANVLEHFTDPWEVLARNKKFLKDKGRVIASIPNIAHYRVIKMLFRKDWKYEERGIMDESHLRFFTLKTIERMFDNASLEITEIKRRLAGSKSKKIINRILMGALNDYLTEEYLIIAQKKNR